MTMQVAPPGLKGLAVSDTELGDVRGDEGFFHYRQYDAVHLARTRTLEDVWTLQFNGALPPAVPVSSIPDPCGTSPKKPPWWWMRPAPGWTTRWAC